MYVCMYVCMYAYMYACSMHVLVGRYTYLVNVIVVNDGVKTGVEVIVHRPPEK